MKKYLLFIFLLLLPFVTLAQTVDETEVQLELEQEIVAPELEQEKLFKAEVLEVLEDQQVEREDGSISAQQTLKLKGLEGEWQDIEFEFSNIGFDVLAYPGYEVGDKVYVYHVEGYDGIDTFYVTDFVRKNRLIWPALLFAVLVVVIGRFKGLRAFIGLLISFAVILWVILPWILKGYDPVWATVFGSIIILLVTFLLTYGFKKKTWIALAGTFVGLVIVALLSVGFTTLSRLTGFNVEEANFLIGLTDQAINIKGILLAGMIIGSIGILNDMTISQTSTVQELAEANPTFSTRELYKRAMKVGVDHIGSMVNTLALAYAGAALPLLLLFTIRKGQYLGYGQVINSEIIATEIIRTLVGSIGLVLVVPVTTYFAALLLKKKGSNK